MTTSGRPEVEASGKVHFIAAAQGAADLLTVRAVSRIRQADVVVYDRSIDPEVLAHIPAGAERIVVDRLSDHQAGLRSDTWELLAAQVRTGRSVVRLHDEDPWLGEQLENEVAALRAADMPIEVVPGIGVFNGPGDTAERPLMRQRSIQSSTWRQTGSDFSAAERANLYRVLGSRRDMRHFTPNTSVDDATLQRLLQAAHQAPSVGLMQPWRFIRVRDVSIRRQIAELVDAERQATAHALGGRSNEFLKLKVEGLRECAELLVAVLAPDDGTIFGRRTMPRDMALCSLACAIQNIWLAARVENIGLGWVSMFEPQKLARLLQLPQGAQPIAVLCIGPVPAFYASPMLEQSGWRYAQSLRDFVYANTWGAPLNLSTCEGFHDH